MALSRLPLVIALVGAPLLAQSNAVPGTDVNLYNVSSSTIYGRRGPSHPNGEVGIGFGHAFCNAGTVHVPWATSPTTQGQMTDVHFKIAFLIARESGGRMVQVSKRGSGVKHSRVTYNLGSSNCGACGSGPSSTFRMGCYDAYSTGFNGNQFNLGPSSEIDPWTGSWNPVGSYFDRGDPMVGGAAATDGVQSLTSSQVGAFDSVKNRITVDEAELIVPSSTFYGQVHLVCEGEPVANRGNNQMSDRLSFNWSGTSWSTSNLGGDVAGSVLNNWTGATVNVGGDGLDNGRFAVGARVTGPSAGVYHYEYAVHNIDNSRGGGTFRIPLPSGVTVTNIGFRDIDGAGANDWNVQQTSSELVFTSPGAGPDFNPVDWNTLYNFWFDCDSAPGGGGVLLDHARTGTGALTVAVLSDVPGGSPVATVQSFGQSCGDCDEAFYESFSGGGIDLSGMAATLAYANGGYNVLSGTATWQAPSGSTLSLGDDAQTTVTLPFSLPYPGGTTTQLRICSNGFVSPAGSNGTAYTPSVSSFLNDQPRWAPAWHDHNPSAGGQIRFASSAAGATLTFDAVPNYSGGGPNSFQMQFEPNGTVHMIWQSLTAAGNDWIVGWSPGGGPLDPGSIDLTTAIPAGISICAASQQGITHSASARPVLGTTVQLITFDIQAGTAFGLTLMGHAQQSPPIDLQPFGMEGCFGYVNGGNSVFWFGPGATVQVPLTIPNDPSFNGLPIVSQSFTYNPPLTSLGFIGSNGVLMVVGAL